MNSLNNRSKLYLEGLEYTVAKTEHWNSFAKVRNDLFGVFDLLAIRPKEIIGVQVTSKSNMGARVKKITESDKANMWLLAGGLIAVHGWHKVKNKWQVEIRNL